MTVDVDLREVLVLEQVLQPAQAEQRSERRGEDRVVLGLRGKGHPGIDLLRATLRQSSDQQGPAESSFVVAGQLLFSRIEATTPLLGHLHDHDATQAAHQSVVHDRGLPAVGQGTLGEVHDRTCVVAVRD
ncbi:hypothetical protein [Aquipuribacter hungaricus]|uniref:hypothetical protein n=1 Tax=Aquipuribacter hungaricus TaxID=545624 RepID=UPI00361AB96B